MIEVDDKDVLVIGNGGEKPVIKDDYNLVIRINRGIWEGASDVWVDATYNRAQVENNKNMKKYKYYWNLNFRAPDPVITVKERQMFMGEYGFEVNPSTGIVLLWILLEKASPRSITIVGFSGDSNHVTNQKNYGVHNWELERSIVKRWIETGKLISLDSQPLCCG